MTRLLVLAGFLLPTVGGFSGVCFSTVIGSVLHRVKILEKTVLVQFENGIMDHC